MSQNLIVILSDEHRRDALGCAGHPQVQTPNLDRLAAAGTRFSRAYTPCPMCVPARASLHTGRYVHQIGTWSSAQPYEGQVPGWPHALHDAGHEVVSIGKLHFRESTPKNGFSREINPLHIRDRTGWTLGLLRDKLPSYDRGTRELAEQVGAGETSYTAYDRSVTREAIRWLAERSAVPAGRPWVLFLSYLSPHYPLVAPPEYYELYDPALVPLPVDPAGVDWGDHPALGEFRRFYNYRDHFDEPTMRRAIAAYFGLCSFLDGQIGRVLEALEQTGLRGSTRILYTSDHGEQLGDHGLWTKMSMFEGSVGVPLILAGEGVPVGVCDTPVSLVDLCPTILEGAGCPQPAGAAAWPGLSLLDIARQPRPGRVAFAEYHDGGCTRAHFMVRRGDWKLIHYVGHRPQLFHLAADPLERRDLGEDPEFAVVRADLQAELRRIVDPEAADAQAHADQARLLAELGGREAVLGLGGDFGYTPIER